MHSKLIQIVSYTLVLLAFLASNGSKLTAQEVQIDSLGFETFLIDEGDTTYLMKKYFMAFLVEGPNRSQSPEIAAEIQAGHMAHINTMAAAGQICIAGPFGDEGAAKGILIFNVPTKEQVEELVSQDPAVQAGRLVLEVRSWWAAKGSMLE